MPTSEYLLLMGPRNLYQQDLKEYFEGKVIDPHKAAVNWDRFVFDHADSNIGKYVMYMSTIVYFFQLGPHTKERRNEIQKAVISGDILFWDKEGTLNTYNKVKENKILSFQKYVTLPDVAQGTEKCKRCGSDRVFSVCAQTRSGDEGMTTFFTCSKCEKRWKG